MTETKTHTPWYLWPFVALWKLIAAIVTLTGRLVAVILGFVLLLVGILVSLTVSARSLGFRSPSWASCSSCAGYSSG